jgi:hypothetical protein
VQAVGEAAEAAVAVAAARPAQPYTYLAAERPSAQETIWIRAVMDQCL